MKTNLSILFCIIFISFAFSQSQPKLDEYPLGSNETSVVVFFFGMDHPTKIGTISNSGIINFKLPKELPKISKELEESFMSELSYTLFSVCDNGQEMISEQENGPSFEAGALSLSTNNNPYAGVIYAVSDKGLMPWVEDPINEEPVLGSYFELIYVAKDFVFSGVCNETQSSMGDDPNMDIAYSFNLNLKSGFNFIEYRIESIHKTDPNVMASFPDKVSVTSVNGIPDCKWVGKYF